MRKHSRRKVLRPSRSAQVVDAAGGMWKTSTKRKHILRNKFNSAKGKTNNYTYSEDTKKHKEKINYEWSVKRRDVPIEVVHNQSTIINGQEYLNDSLPTTFSDDTSVFQSFLFDDFELRKNMTMHTALRQKNILLINDNVVQTNTITKTLINLTSNIKVIKSLAELNINSKFLPDLLIISIQLKHDDVLKLTDILRRFPAINDAIIILQIDENDAALAANFISFGINDYFTHSIAEQDLVARIRLHLQHKQYLDSMRSLLKCSFSMAARDSLTSLFNRRYFDIHIKQLVNHCNYTYNTKLHLLMFDIDDFKQVNDTYGHQAGDQVLIKTAQMLKNSCRANDFIVRYGGEEFLMILTNIDCAKVMNIAERVRVGIECQIFQVSHEAKPLRQTISIGVTQYRKGESVEQFIERADQAMYEAKRTGKNKIIKL